MKNILGLAKICWLSTQKRNIMIFVVYVQPLFLLVMYILASPFGADALQKAYWFVVINGSVLSCWSINVFATISDINRDRWTGMLDVVRSSPTSLLTVFIVRALMNSFHAFSSLLILAIGAFIWFQPEINLGYFRVVSSLFGIFLVIGMFSFIFAALVGMSPLANHIMNFIEYPIFIISGIGFTIGILPNMLQWFALLFPFGYLTESLRYSVGISLIEVKTIHAGLYVAGAGTILISVVGVILLYVMNKRLGDKGALV
jgi:ABC-2 type transport system permease protein